MIIIITTYSSSHSTLRNKSKNFYFVGFLRYHPNIRRDRGGKEKFTIQESNHTFLFRIRKLEPTCLMFPPERCLISLVPATQNTCLHIAISYRYTTKVAVTSLFPFDNSKAQNCHTVQILPPHITTKTASCIVIRLPNAQPRNRG
jgi:hypothetical protein